MKGLAKPIADGPRYFCTSCDGNTFYLFQDMSVSCATCKKHSINLQIKDYRNT